MNVHKFIKYSDYHKRIILSHFNNCLRSYPNEIKDYVYHLLNNLVKRCEQSYEDKVVKSFCSYDDVKHHNEHYLTNGLYTNVIKPKKYYELWSQE